MQSVLRAAALTVIGTLIFWTATLANAGGTAARPVHSDMTVTKHMDAATPKMYGAAVSLNPQPLPPRQATTAESFNFLQNSTDQVIKSIGEGLATMARKG